MPFTFGGSWMLFLIPIKSCRNFEFTIFNCEPVPSYNKWAISQVSHDVRTEVSQEVMFGTLRNARFSLSLGQLLTQVIKWLTGYTMLVRSGKSLLRARKVGVGSWYYI